jgi:hypothetical protein
LIAGRRPAECISAGALADASPGSRASREADCKVPLGTTNGSATWPDPLRPVHTHDVGRTRAPDRTALYDRRYCNEARLSRKSATSDCTRNGGTTTSILGDLASPIPVDRPRPWPPEHCCPTTNLRTGLRVDLCDSLASWRQRRCSSWPPIGSAPAPTSCLCTGCKGSGQVALLLIVQSGHAGLDRPTCALASERGSGRPVRSTPPHPGIHWGVLRHT